MPRGKKVVVTLTEKQLDDLISCVDFALEQGAAYGHITQQEQALREQHRKKLLEKLKQSA